MCPNVFVLALIVPSVTLDIYENKPEIGYKVNDHGDLNDQTHDPHHVLDEDFESDEDEVFVCLLSFLLVVEVLFLLEFDEQYDYPLEESRAEQKFKVFQS